jgi:hypothetical protein
MTTDLVLIAKSQGVTTVTLNRPEALNALSGALRQTLAETFDALRGCGHPGHHFDRCRTCLYRWLRLERIGR